MSDEKIHPVRSTVVLSGDDPDRKYGIAEYLGRRITTLKPPMHKAPNPIAALRLLNLAQWNFFGVAFLAWTLDALDFFTVSLTISNLAKEFDKKPSDITWGITLVLMLRSIGAVTFGIAGDRYGRKWPFIVNNMLFIVLELGTGFCQTYKQFLGVRALFGIAMGGLYGNAAATALEDCPIEARGIISGMFQQGYAFGYLLATVFARALVNTTPHEWRPLYWFAATLPLIVIVWRLFLPETQSFRDRQFIRQSQPSAASNFVAEGKVAVRRHWVLLVYMVLLMAGFNFMSHGSQDLYPTM
jgi:SHS family lactate transporter-like MFS transporter